MPKNRVACFFLTHGVDIQRALQARTTNSQGDRLTWTCQFLVDREWCHNPTQRLFTRSIWSATQN